MRSVPDDFDPAVVAAIDARLAAVAVEHGVRIPWARTRELGSASVPPAIARWVLAVFAAEPDRPSPPTPQLRAVAEEGFRELVERWAPG